MSEEPDITWQPEPPDEDFYQIRVTSDRALSDTQARQLFSLIGYAFRIHLRGESLGEPARVRPNRWTGYYDITKSASDDWAAHIIEALASARLFAVQGSPLRTTARKGAPGTRAAPGLGPIVLRFEFA
jgi:hypothetical protein